MTKCWFCNGEKEMIWSSDFSFEDYGYEGEGIVAELSCPNCGANAQFTIKSGEEE